MQLSPHFALEELVYSQTAQEGGINNTPSEAVVANLTTQAQGLELVRALLGNPMLVTSGYRCPALNKVVGGVPDSAHLVGFGTDFKCPAFGTPLQIVEAIVASDIKFDQCIQEGTWVHISFAPAMRQQTLTADFHDGGETTYTSGVA